MDHSLALIVPADHKTTADLVSVVLGHAQPGDETYIVPLSADGTEPATHYGCHSAATDQFIAIIEGGKQGGLPPAPWAAVGLTEQQVLDMAAALTVSVKEIDSYTTNFNDTIGGLGLRRVVIEVPRA